MPDHPAPAPRALQPAALALARSLAWGLWWGGWLVLGAFGHQHQPLWAAGLGTLAAWLLCIAGLLAWRRAWSRTGLLVALGLGSLLVGAGLLLQQAAWLVPGWALLVVAASRTVQQQRRGHTTAPPWWPACAGAALAWALAGDPTALHTGGQTLGLGLGLALPLAVTTTAALLAWLALRPGQAPRVAACRAGLFDCAFPPLRRAAANPSRLAHQAALLAMLPMMAALPAMADWCSSGGWSPRTVTALHLLAMLAPAGCLHGQARWRPGPWAVAGCLLAGGGALWWWPGLQGLMAAALLHGAAWSLAWYAPLAERHQACAAPRGSPAGAPAASPAWAGALLAAAALWALGSGLHHAGPAALQTAHAMLALCGLVAGLRSAMGARPRGSRPRTLQHTAPPEPLQHPGHAHAHHTHADTNTKPCPAGAAQPPGPTF